MEDRKRGIEGERRKYTENYWRENKKQDTAFPNPFARSDYLLEDFLKSFLL
jgi:hypothetical protein